MQLRSGATFLILQSLWVSVMGTPLTRNKGREGQHNRRPFVLPDIICRRLTPPSVPRSRLPYASARARARLPRRLAKPPLAPWRRVWVGRLRVRRRLKRGVGRRCGLSPEMEEAAAESARRGFASLRGSRARARADANGRRNRGTDGRVAGGHIHHQEERRDAVCALRSSSLLIEFPCTLTHNDCRIRNVAATSQLHAMPRRNTLGPLMLRFLRLLRLAFWRAFQHDAFATLKPRPIPPF